MTKQDQVYIDQFLWHHFLRVTSISLFFSSNNVLLYLYFSPGQTVEVVLIEWQPTYQFQYQPESQQSQAKHLFIVKQSITDKQFSNKNAATILLVPVP